MTASADEVAAPEPDAAPTSAAARAPRTRPANRMTGGARRRRDRSRIRRAIIVLTAIAGVLVVAVVTTVLLWGAYRPAADPIDAAPVNALAVVLDSPACTEGGATTVRILGLQPTVRTQISGCGYAENRQVAIQYLAGNPDLARRAGTTVAGPAHAAELAIPLVWLGSALALTLVALAAAIVRYRRHRPATDTAISLAALQERLAAPAVGGSSAQGPPADEGAAAPEDEWAQRIDRVGE